MSTNLQPEQVLFLMEPAALLDQPTTLLIVCFQASYFASTPIDNLYCSADRTAVKVNFSKFFARGGPDIPVISRRKYCQLGFGVE